MPEVNSDKPMKLVVIVTHKDKEKELEKELVSKNLPLTRLESRGGFLKQKNSTFLLGVEENKVEEIMEVVKQVCKTKEELVAAPAPAIPDPGEASLPLNGSTKIKVGGATVFVADIDKFMKV